MRSSIVNRIKAAPTNQINERPTKTESPPLNRSTGILFSLTIAILQAGCTEADRYSGKTPEQRAQMYHEDRIKITMRWTCNLLSEEVHKYKEAKRTSVELGKEYFMEYPRHFHYATTIYKPVILGTLRDHPYKLPRSELYIGYIRPFDFDTLDCVETVSNWRSHKSEWDAVRKALLLGGSPIRGR
jgi:hypothetical protein